MMFAGLTILQLFMYLLVYHPESYTTKYFIMSKHRLIMNITAKANDTNDILQTFR